MTWTGGAGDGLWQTAENWSTGAVPGQTDDVCIGAEFNVTLSAAAPAINTLTCDGTLAVSTTLTIAAPSTINNTFTLSGILTGNGALTVTSVMNWTGGQIGTAITNIAPGASLNIFGTAAHSLMNNRALNNAGTATLSGAASMSLLAGAVFNNQAGATFDMQNDMTIFGSQVNTINNAGAWRKSAGTGTSLIFGTNLSFNNTGSVSVESGALSLTDGTSTGSFTVASSSTLTLGGGWNIAGTFGGPGTLMIFPGILNFNGPTDFSALSGPMNIDTTVNFRTGGPVILPALVNLGPNRPDAANIAATDDVLVPGVLNWIGGPISGTGTVTIASDASMNITTEWPHTLNIRALNNAGTVFLYEQATVSMGAGGVFNNQAGATFDIQNDRAISGSAGTTINNAGTWRKSAGTGTNTVGATFNNTGTISAQTGTLSFAGAFSQLDGGLALVGGSLRFSSPLNIQGGTLRGNGLITGDVVNSGGIVAPGTRTNFGSLQIAGNYTQQNSGALNIKVGGGNVGTFDVVEVSDSATFDGTLNLSLIGPFRPPLGSTYEVFNYGSGSGTFATVTGTEIGDSLAFETNYNPTNLTLEVVQLPQLEGKGGNVHVSSR